MNQFTFNLIKSRGEYFSIMSHGWIQISPEVFQRLSDQLDVTETPFSDAGDPVLHATHDLSIPEEPWGASMGVGRVKAHALTSVVGVVIYCPRIATRHHNGPKMHWRTLVNEVLLYLLLNIPELTFQSCQPLCRWHPGRNTVRIPDSIHTDMC